MVRPDELGSDSLVRKNFEEKGVLDPSVDEVNFLHAGIESMKCRPDFRNHSVHDDLLFSEKTGVILCDAMDQLTRNHYTFDVAQIDELLRLQRGSDTRGGHI